MGKLLRSMLLARTAAGIVQRIGETVSRVTAIVLCMMLAGLFAISALGCAAAALWIYLRPLIGPVLAPLSVAGVFLLLCVCLIAMSRVIAGRKAAPSAPGAAPSSVAATDPLAALSNEAVRLFREHKGAALLSAVVAGLIAARKR